MIFFCRCVVKYLYDLYSHFSLNMLGFLVEVLEKGSPSCQAPVMTIIHCLLHYVDMQTATQMINSDLLRTVARFVESPHWKEALKILKLAVTRSSTLVAPPSAGSSSASSVAAGGGAASVSYPWETGPGANFAEADLYFKKELPGRTMEFTFDLSQTPVIGRRSTSSGTVYAVSSASAASSRTGGRVSLLFNNPPPSAASTVTASTLGGISSIPEDRDSLVSSSAASTLGAAAGSAAAALGGGGSVSSVTMTLGGAGAVGVGPGGKGRSPWPQQLGGGPDGACMSPRRSMSLAAADAGAVSGWRRPWMSQVRKRSS